MENVIIREFKREDLEKIMKIWLFENIRTHNYIDKNYWESNFEMVKGMILESKIYTSEISGEIVAFIGLVENYIAGIFVREEFQSLGVGRKLLERAKKDEDFLTLNVYSKNKRAINFYLREGFKIESKSEDTGTGEMELKMNWTALRD